MLTLARRSFGGILIGGTVTLMPYPKRLLNDYEELAVDLHPHWSYFIEPVLALLASIVVTVVALVAFELDSWVRAVLIALIVLSALALGWRYVRWSTTHFVVTSDRVIFRTGVVAKAGIEIPLERVNSVHFSQGIFERIVGAGDLLIESGSEGGQQRFSDVKNPDKVQNAIHGQKEQNEQRMRAADRGAGGSDVASQLERLEGLRDRGTLTHDEFVAQKRRLLGG